jgi:hypothetical protein
MVALASEQAVGAGEQLHRALAGQFLVLAAQTMKFFPGARLNE